MKNISIQKCPCTKVNPLSIKNIKKCFDVKSPSQSSRHFASVVSVSCLGQSILGRDDDGATTTKVGCTKRLLEVPIKQKGKSKCKRNEQSKEVRRKRMIRNE